MTEVTSKIIEVGSNIPPRLKELWIWFEAVYWWDWGDPGLLAALIKEEQVPEEFRIALADIVAEVRKRHKRSAVSARIRFNLARFSMELAEVRDETVSDKEAISGMSEETRSEPIEVIRATQKAIRDRNESMAKVTGVSKDTLENIRRDFQSRIDRWPTV